MITYNSFDEVPKEDKLKPRLTNGEWVIVFDTIEEHAEYLKTLNTTEE